MKLDKELSGLQRTVLEELWFIYGNDGPKFSMNDHQFIQAILERGEDLRDFYNPTKDCLEAVDAVIK